uniref:Uncharacterized protein n=1 Tax=Plectus sambesii TaxID=2011161 RepID=A0A914V6Q4_9BILA
MKRCPDENLRSSAAAVCAQWSKEHFTRKSDDNRLAVVGADGRAVHSVRPATMPTTGRDDRQKCRPSPVGVRNLTADRLDRAQIYNRAPARTQWDNPAGNGPTMGRKAACRRRIRTCNGSPARTVRRVVAALRGAAVSRRTSAAACQPAERRTHTRNLPVVTQSSRGRLCPTRPARATQSACANVAANPLSCPEGGNTPERRAVATCSNQTIV